MWLTFAMREGKNREIRNVLGALGLKVNRLIRVSYGPFQLGELPAGAVEEVRTRTLREQLGARIAALAGADFSGPIVERESPEPTVTRLPHRTEVRDTKPSAVGKRPRPTTTSKDRNRPNLASAGDGPGRPSADGRSRRPPRNDGEKQEAKRGHHGPFRHKKRRR